MMNFNAMMNPNAMQLMKQLNEVSFAIDEVILYLDTHPCDQEAMNYYHRCLAMRQEAMCAYQSMFGPLTKDGIESDDYWTWIEGPWPWEGGNC